MQSSLDKPFSIFQIADLFRAQPLVRETSRQNRYSDGLYIARSMKISWQSTVNI